jgi:hypothetical protein
VRLEFTNTTATIPDVRPFLGGRIILIPNAEVERYLEVGKGNENE